MALTYPYPLAFLSDKLPVREASWSIRRSDKTNGQGDGRVWQAELAPPIWQASLVFSARREADARPIAARINALHGSKEAFLLCDPMIRGPVSDPTGAALAGSTVTISSIASSRLQVNFAGLPAAFKLGAGDRFTLVDGAAVYMGELSDDATATSGGAASAPVFPAIPAGFSAGAAAVFVRPYIKAIIAPAAFTGWTISVGAIAQGASIDVLQKVGG
ncbi:hypothetical protein DL1_11975 [Thioclava dalianensis]|uniref:Uncharacterized protein n=1 Tax=Thioclava dalianensis TaxID=1185766 RepID=A0A074TE40_9RHOB|nr:hypothetical protein [Thioclava dalianensis]KEP68440.1 hypothetical protein DL1_11975 [Thioclava dalianensis]SFN62812.1 hypothetical protein SAMN05216224_10858 [Thioclava dalianensis]